MVSMPDQTVYGWQVGRSLRMTRDVDLPHESQGEQWLDE